MRECPCFRNGDCDKRHKDCHSICDEYKKWREEADREKAMRADTEGAYLSYICPKINQRRKQKNAKSRI